MRAEGFSLLEVLVTVFILAIGMLGLAALQANSLRFNQGAYLRSVALLQATSMADRMRANIGAVMTGSYDNFDDQVQSPECSVCTPAEIALQDRIDWAAENTAWLPAGVGDITRSDDLVTITVFYDEERTGATGRGCGNDKSVDLSCTRISFQVAS